MSDVKDKDLDIYDIFCEKCESMLDILKHPNRQVDELDTETPKQLSSDEDKNVDYEKILKKVEKGDALSKEELETIDVREMVKNEYYKKLSGKGDIKKRIIDMIDDAGNSDDNTQAYLVCKNCAFSKKIKPGYKVVTKNPEGTISTNEITNESMLRNRVHFGINPKTRVFDCPNKECPSHKKDSPTEAIFFRKHQKTHEVIFCCTTCLTIKMN